MKMSFNWIDFVVGFLLLESVLILSLTYSGKPYLNIFGKSPKANIFSSILLTIVALEIYTFKYDISTLINNGVLLGVVVMYLSYLIFGPWFHKHLLSDNNKINVSTVTTE
jgi:hypothetical protein